MRNADRGQGAVKIVAPEIEEFDEAREARRQIVILPDEKLQEIAMIGQAIHDLRSGEAPAIQLAGKMLCRSSAPLRWH